MNYRFGDVALAALGKVFHHFFSKVDGDGGGAGEEAAGGCIDAGGGETGEEKLRELVDHLGIAVGARMGWGGGIFRQRGIRDRQIHWDRERGWEEGRDISRGNGLR